MRRLPQHQPHNLPGQATAPVIPASALAAAHVLPVPAPAFPIAQQGQVAQPQGLFMLQPLSQRNIVQLGPDVRRRQNRSGPVNILGEQAVPLRQWPIQQQQPSQLQVQLPEQLLTASTTTSATATTIHQASLGQLQPKFQVLQQQQQQAQ